MRKFLWTNVVAGVLLLLASQHPVTANISQQEDAATLQQFAANYPGFYMFSNWTGGTPCTSNWTAVKCEYDNSTADYDPSTAGVRVVALDLYGAQLTGEAPALSGIETLRAMNLSKNNFTGLSALPPNLVTLDLSTNKLMGSLDTLCTISTLRHIDISNNRQLQGTFPACLGTLADLRHLNLSRTNLSGPLPTEWGTLSKLQVLDVSYTAQGYATDSLIVPDSWGGMQNLSYLDISASWAIRDFDFQGGFGSSFYDASVTTWIMSSLETFKCHHCRWAAAIDPLMFPGASLKHLDLSYNPVIISGAPQLPNYWGDMSLVTLKLRGCNLTATTPKSLANWTKNPDGVSGLINNIRVLDLGDNPDLNFTSMETFFGQMSLTELYLDNTKVTLGAGQTGWPHLPCTLSYPDFSVPGAPAGAMCALMIEHIDPWPPALSPALHLGEIQLITSNGVLLTPGTLQLYQPSTLNPNVTDAGACFDGDPSTMCANNNATDEYPNLTISYPCNTRVVKVVVMNRNDCCQEAITGFAMRFRDHTNTLLYEYQFPGAQQQYSITRGPVDTSADGICRLETREEWAGLLQWKEYFRGPVQPESWSLANLPSAGTFDCPPTPWEGTACDANTGRITVIDLMGLRQCAPETGDPCPFPAGIFRKPSALRVLRIPGIGMQDSMGPSTLMHNGGLLEELDLSNNPYLTGPLDPLWPSFMPRLKYLNLSRTSDMGSLPPTYLSSPGWGANLQYLGLAFCNLRDPLPGYWTISNSLKQVELQGNMLVTLPDFHQSVDVTMLDLSNNMLNGSLPATWVDKMPALVDLRLSGNSFTGLPDMSQLFQLTHLDASNNQVQRFPPDWPASIRQLYLDHNMLTGTIPTTFIDAGTAGAALPNLVCLELGYNPGLCGEIPINCLCFDRIGTSLGLDCVTQTPLSTNTTCRPQTAQCRSGSATNATEPPTPGYSPDPPPTTTGGLETADAAYLQQFKASFNNSIFQDNYMLWSGDLPCGSAWQYVTCSTDQRVVGLALPGARLSGSLPALDGLDRLEVLDLSNNQITEMGALPHSLRALIVARNLLTEMPDICSTGGSLQHLNVSMNPQLQGTFPACLSNLTNLTSLVASHTNLTGYLPEEWGSLSQLQILDVSYTSWTPNLTTTAEGFPYLLPSSWGGMVSLNYLDMSASRGYNTILDGRLPVSWYDPNTARSTFIMNNLTTFICHHCGWKYAADAAAFPHAVSLKHLDISYNPLSTESSGSYGYNQLPDTYADLNLEVLKVRGCNLTATSPTMLSPWTKHADGTGLVNTLRVLDLGDNPTLAFTTMEAFFGQMDLWELYLDNTAVTLGAGQTGWPNLPCTLTYKNLSLVSAPAPLSICSIRIEHTNPTPSSTPQLHIGELHLITNNGTPIPLEDLQLSQSSNLAFNTGPAVCFDGHPGSYCAADGGVDPNPTLTIGYNCSAGLDRVVVMNRLDCCQERLASFTVKFLDPNGVVYYKYNFTTLQNIYVIKPGIQDTNTTGICRSNTTKAWMDLLDWKATWTGPPQPYGWDAGNVPTGLNPGCPAVPWQGVTCDNTTGHITAIDLSNNALCAAYDTSPCSVPQNLLQNLPALRSLNLSHTNMQGMTAMNLLSSSMLEVLDLSKPGISGPPNPAWPSLVPKLRFLNISESYNVVSAGPLPATWFINAPWGSTLQYLGVAMSALVSSTIPQGTWNLQALQQLELQGNALTGSLPEWSAPLNLTALDASSNQLNGTLPASWATALPALKSLKLSQNRFSGGLPGSWGDYTVTPHLSLSRFECDGCGLSGPIPPWGDTACRSDGLNYLDLSRNSLSGSFSTTWKAFGSLKYMDVSMNQLIGTLFGGPTVCTMTLLETLRLHTNNFTGALFDGQPATATTYPYLLLVDASNNQLSGTVPAYLPPSLQQLLLDHNALTGSIPVQFADMGTGVGAFPNLTCWSLNDNPGLCDLAPSNSVCFDTVGTDIGNNCSAPGEPVVVPGGYASCRVPVLDCPGWSGATNQAPNNTTQTGNTTDGNTTTPDNTTAGGNTTATGNTTSPAPNNTTPTESPSPPPPPPVPPIPAGSLEEVPSLLSLKDAAADNATLTKLASWQDGVSPCTNSTTTGTCVLCDSTMLDDVCGTSVNGVFYCNWRYVECRDWRVVTINMANQGLVFSNLPGLLANGTIIENLDISGNSSVLGGTLPREYGSWTNMNIFRIRGALSGYLPQEYYGNSWQYRRAFELYDTNLTGDIPWSYFEACSQLENFTIDGAQIQGYVPDNSRYCNNLVKFVVQRTPVESSFWLLNYGYVNLPRLTTIGFGGTKLSLPSWTEIKDNLRHNNFPLTSVSFFDSNLTGPIGPLSYYFPQLKRLDLSGNKFWGIVPPDLTSYTGLQKVNLSSNGLYGTLPPGLLERFDPVLGRSLDLSHNRLSGTLPELAPSASLVPVVKLGWNQLGGSIPDSWSPLMLNSTAFDVRQNRLEGKLPTGFSTGPLPSSLQRSIMFDNNTCMCGSLPTWFNSTPNASNSVTWSGTALGTACTGTCTYPPLAQAVHPDWAGLQALASAITGGSAEIVNAFRASWTNVTGNPCHDMDPNCAMCNYSPYSSSCGAMSGYYGIGAPSYYCNALGVACKAGRVTSLDLMYLNGIVINILPAGMGQLTQLQNLRLGVVPQIAASPTSLWASLSSLTSIDLTSSTYGPLDALPAAWSAIPGLQRIDITRATFAAGGIPESWANLSNLYSISLSYLTFNGTDPVVLPAGWANMSLRELRLDTLTGVTGTLPALWATGFPSLNNLQLSSLLGVKLTAADVSDLLRLRGPNPANAAGYSPGLTSLILNNVNLTGTIPSGLFALTELRHLDLASNNLAGALESYNWTALPRLSKISLANNNLTGTLPLAWGALRGYVNIDVSFNHITGPLPANWSDIGPDGRAMELATLSASYNSLTGTLPDSWSKLPSNVPTTLYLSYNNLTGSIPASWGERQSDPTTPYGAWSTVDVSYNPSMCGSIPPWYYTRYVRSSGMYGGQQDILQLTNQIRGTSLSALCRPPVFSHYFSTLYAFYPTVGRPVGLQLVSKTPFASTTNNYTWSVDITTPNNSMPQRVGAMLQSNVSGTDYIWTMVVPGYFFPKNGTYNLTVTNVQNSSIIATNRQISLTVFPALSYSDASSFSIDMPNRAVGASATITVRLNDLNGEPQTSATSSLYVSINNWSSGFRPSLSLYDFINTAPGVYKYYNYTATAIETVDFMIQVDGTHVPCDPRGLPAGQACRSNSYNPEYTYGSDSMYGSSMFSQNYGMGLNVTSVMPSVVDPNATVNGMLLQTVGEPARRSWNDSATLLVIPAGTWVLLYVPVARIGGGTFFRDPGFYAQVSLNGTAAAASAVNGTTNGTANATTTTSNTNSSTTVGSTNTTSNGTVAGSNTTLANTANGTTGANATAAAASSFVQYKGQWSSSNGSYIIALKVPFAGIWKGRVELKQSTTSNTSIAIKAISLNASAVFAVAARSTFNTTGTTRVGDYLSIVATLRSLQNVMANRADNVVITVKGSLSGAVAVSPLVMQPDNTWIATIIPSKEETLTISMSIDNLGVGSQTVVIAGKSAGYLAFNSSMQQASLQAQSLAVTSGITEGALLMAYTNETSFVSIPLVDQIGNPYYLDPGLKGVLSLIPPPQDVMLLAKYNLTTAATSNTTTSGGTSTATTGGTLKPPSPSPSLSPTVTPAISPQPSPSPSPYSSPTPISPPSLSPSPISSPTTLISPSPSPASPSPPGTGMLTSPRPPSPSPVTSPNPPLVSPSPNPVSPSSPAPAAGRRRALLQSGNNDLDRSEIGSGLLGRRMDRVRRSGAAPQRRLLQTATTTAPANSTSTWTYSTGSYDSFYSFSSYDGYSSWGDDGYDMYGYSMYGYYYPYNPDYKPPPSVWTPNGYIYYMADYAVEAPDVAVLDPAPPIPPSNVTQNTTSPGTTTSGGTTSTNATSMTTTAGNMMGPDLGNPVQDSLSIEPNVTTVIGVFDSYNGALSFQLVPPAAITYTALLSMRHPNINTSFVMRKFQLAVVPNPALAAPPPTINTTNTTAATGAATAANVALFNPLSNPRFDFVATFKRLSNTTYPGGSTQALAAFKAIVAGNAVLNGSDWVTAAVIAGAPLKINATAWFPSNYPNISSPFQGLSALDYYAFLLNKLPTVAFSSDLYPAFVATDALVQSFNISFPGAAPVNGSAYGAAAPATSTTTDTAAAPVAVTVVNIQTSDLAVVVAQTSAAATPPAVDLSKIVDRTPPVITLTGSAYMPVLQADIFTDPGATAYDNIDGNSVNIITRLQLCARPSGIETAAANDSRALACGGALLSVNTSAASNSNETYVLSYMARDAAGNQATPLRRYVIVNLRCPAPEKWCPSLSTCSVKGLCLATMSSGSSTSSSSTSSKAVIVYTPPVDKTPPQLKLLGTGMAAMTSTGAVIMMDNVTWKADWTDPGASAWDAVDGNLTGRIQSFGAGGVDTSIPTPPEKQFSYVVEYAVEDKTGNAAPIARRLLRIVCPKGESYCIDPDTNKATCTVVGVCGASSALSYGPAPAAGSSASAASSASSKAASPAAVVQKPPTAPRMALLVPGPVQVPAGQTYDRCSENAALGELCERGASAEDDKDGNLDRQVLVCGSRWRPPSNQRAVPVLLACGIKGEVPGDYNITFTVTNSAGLASTVTRKITIKAMCPPGETLCDDKVTCSVAGSCASRSANSTSLQSPSATAKPVLVNQPPRIQLISSSGFEAVVRVRRGSAYDVCKEGVAPTAVAPCEPGAIAVDPDGLIPDDGTAPRPVNKTSEIVVCPPDICVNRGCSPADLRRNYFSNKGLQGCGINTDVDEGTQYLIDFWVWDNGSPTLNATVTHTVVVDKPCPDPSAPYYCTDASTGSRFCSGSPCSTAGKLLPPAKPLPKLRLLPSSAPAYIQYGKPARFDVRPCSSLSNSNSCGAAAWQVVPTQGKQDLTPYITVSLETECDSSAAKDCSSCDLAALATSGTCMPGSYLLTYTVMNDDGATDTATRRLYVYQAIYLSARLTLYTGIADGMEAKGIASNLSNTDTAEFADAAGLVFGNLTTDLRSRMEPGDIQFMAGSVESVQSPGSWDIVVTAKLYLHNPSTVHKKAVDAFEQSLTKAAGTGRKLLASADDDDTNLAAPQQETAGNGYAAVGTAHHAVQASYYSRTTRPVLTNNHIDRLRSNVQLLQQGMSKFQRVSRMAVEAGDTETCDTATDCVAQPAQRRRLLATAGSLDDLVSAMEASIISNMGATDPSTTELTPQQIDVLQVYVSSLTATVQELEQRVTDLSGSGTGLSTNINMAFGDNAEQRVTDSEQQTTTMYQDLLGDFNIMVTSVNNIADQALAKFTEQAAKAADLAALSSDAITSLRESAALAQAFTQRFVEQTMMIDAATGQPLEDWSCDRGKYLDVHFAVNRTANTSDTSTSARRRQLLADTSAVSDSGPTGGAASSDGSVPWQGYVIDLLAKTRNWAVDDTDIPEQPRYVGATPGRNRVIGGLFLHTTRKTEDPSTECSGSGFQAQYDFRCQKSAVPLARNATLLTEYLASLFAADTDDIYPYGVDPAFLRTSEALYRPELQGNEGWYYNVSDTLEVPPTTGTPYGFFHRHLQGYHSGFPILIPTRTSATRSSLALQYLLDGNYLDKKSKRLTAELLTYNADLRVVGYTKTSFDWQENGAITGFIDVRTVPAIKSAAEGSTSTSASWLAPLWLLCIAFCITIAIETRKHLKHYEGDKPLLVVLKSGDCLLNFLTAFIMIVSVFLLTGYCATPAPAIKPKPAYEVYDSLTYSNARIFMPAKTYSATAVSAVQDSLTKSGTKLDTVFDGGQAPSEPGCAGRWLLPDADSDWDDWASFMKTVHQSVDVWAAYTLLQGIILILLVLKLVRAWSFQSKLGVICNTLVLAAPQLAHLLVVIVSCMVLFATLTNLASGDSVSNISDYRASFEETFRTVLGLGFVKMADVLPVEVLRTFTQNLLVIIMYYGRTVLFVMILAQYFMATLGNTFNQLKRQTQGAKGSSIKKDIIRDIYPELRVKLRRFLRGPKFSPTARDHSGAAVEIPAGAEALLAFIKARCPHLVTAKTFGDRASAIQIGDRFLDLGTFQDLLSELAVSNSRSSHIVVELLSQQRRAAAAYAEQAESRLAASGRRGSESEARDSTAKDATVAKYTEAHKDPEAARHAGSTRVEVMGAAAAVAAALAAAEQFMSSVGKAVDAQELTEARLQLSEALQLTGALTGVEAGHDYTLEDLMHVIDRELELHQQIYGAIWSAVTAMERWSTGVSRWLAKVTFETNGWMANNAQIATQYYGAAGSQVICYSSIPVPAEADLTQPPVEQRPQLPLQPPQLMPIASAGGATSSVSGIRLGADLGTIATDSDAGSPTARPGLMQGITNKWVSTTGGGSVAGSVAGGRFADNTRMTASGVSIDLQHVQSGGRNSPAWHRLVSLPRGQDDSLKDSVKSPGAVSLHSRTFGHHSPATSLSGAAAASIQGSLGGDSGQELLEFTDSDSPRSATGGRLAADRERSSSEAGASSRGGATSAGMPGSRPQSGGAKPNQVVPLRGVPVGGGDSPAVSSRRSVSIEDLGGGIMGPASQTSRVSGEAAYPGSVEGSGSASERE